MKSTFYRYYCLERPPMPGGIPRGVVHIETFDDKTLVDSINREAWGWVEYECELTEYEIDEFELAKEEMP